MPKPIFEFFEMVVDELSVAPSTVITHDDLRTEDDETSLLEAIMAELKVNSEIEAMPAAINELKAHFKARGAELPFKYDLDIGRFTATQPDFLAFVSKMREIRSIAKRNRDFEVRVAHELAHRAKGGEIHRVGHPRDKQKSREKFNVYLEKLGFETPVLYGRDKDGGLDILWMLPLGTVPHRPIVSVQCKNGEFDIDGASISLQTANSCLARHRGLQNQVHLPCVLFNDYIHRTMLHPRPMGFVPLGLTDLAPLKQDVSVVCI